MAFASQFKKLAESWLSKFWVSIFVLNDLDKQNLVQIMAIKL